MAIQIFKSRRRFCRGEGVFQFFVGFTAFCLFLSSSGVHGFFIDLESLGFSSSKDDDTERSGDESEISSGPQLLIAEPALEKSSSSSNQQIVEIESKTDPNKSVKLTLAELKQLVMGTVKDMTPKIPPINIKISANKDRTTTTTTTTTPTPAPRKINKYKYSVDEFGSYWRRPESDSSSFILPPYDDGDIEEHYRESNEVSGYGDYAPVKTSSEEKKKGWFDVAKAAFKAPTHMVNSYTKTLSKWRTGGNKKPSNKRYRPIPDITYKPERRRRKRPPTRTRRPTKSRGRAGHRRRGHVPKHQRLHSSHYDDEYDNSDSSYYYSRGSNKYSSGSYGDYDDAWDRADIGFDSTLPRDDTPFNMNPPLPLPY